MHHVRRCHPSSASADNPAALPADVHNAINKAATVDKLQTGGMREGTPNRCIADAEDL